MPLPQDLDLPTDGYLLPSGQGLALPECSWLLEHNRDSLQDMAMSARKEHGCDGEGGLQSC